MKKSIITFIIFCFFYDTSYTQTIDSTKQIINFRAATSVTNNGFSFVPAFSLGKPATIFNLNINGGKRLSFEPEFRFSLLDAKPWSFIFIWRYKVINKRKFQLTAGAHLPAVPFRTIEYDKNGVKHETLATYRFLPFELTPNIAINKNISIGLMYLYSRGFGDAIRNTNVIMLRSNISNIKLSQNYALRLFPQLFYLSLDDKNGYYFAGSASISKKNFPFSVSSMINKPLKTTIAGKDFDWNLSLIYTIDRKYTKQ